MNAIENNFSHEMMSPLNPILSGAAVLKNSIIKVFKDEESKILEDESISDIEGYSSNQLQLVGSNKQVCNLLKGVISIEQSAMAIWYFNTNMMMRQKIIMMQQHSVQRVDVSSMYDTIIKVIWPFEQFIVERKTNIYVIDRMFENTTLNFDSTSY
jgi:hypothetical protein